MTEYERVEGKLRDILRLAANALALKTTPYGSKLSTAEEKSLNSLISQILSLVEIRADNQNLPEDPYNYEQECRESTAYGEAQQDMLTQNWVRVIPKPKRK